MTGLGPMLGMSPFPAVCAFNQAQQLASEANAAAALNAILKRDLSGCLNALAPPLPEPGIHWQKTSGKSWRVVIGR